MWNQVSLSCDNPSGWQLFFHVSIIRHGSTVQLCGKMRSTRDVFGYVHCDWWGGKMEMWCWSVGVFQVAHSSKNYLQILWMSETDTRCWTWKRTERALKVEAASMPQEVSMPKEVSKLHAAFRPLRFCDENVPLLQLNEAQFVPVWALNNFPNSKPSIDGELLEKLLLDPTAVRKLPPLDAILHHCLDGRYALLCPNHKRQNGASLCSSSLSQCDVEDDVCRQCSCGDILFRQMGRRQRRPCDSDTWKTGGFFCCPCREERQSDSRCPCEAW